MGDYFGKIWWLVNVLTYGSLEKHTRDILQEIGASLTGKDKFETFSGQLFKRLREEKKNEK